MLCPSCKNQLQKISVTTNQGGRFEVDHCHFCGGTWFDPYEINRLPLHEVVNLANQTVQRKKKFAQSKKYLCPNDYLELVPLKGAAVPVGVRLLSCQKCLGVFATQKDLWDFKKHQDQALSAYEMGEKFFPPLSSVFIPVITFLFLLANTFITIRYLQQIRDERIFAESQVNNLQILPLSPNSVAISFITYSKVSTQIVYGLSSLEMHQEEISTQPTTTHHIVLTGLKEDKTYLYKLKLTDGQGKVYTTDLKLLKIVPPQRDPANGGKNFFHSP